jgi:hypothetical protein
MSGIYSGVTAMSGIYSGVTAMSGIYSGVTAMSGIGIKLYSMLEALTFIKLFRGGMIRAAFDWLLNMFWLHKNGHGPDD